LAKHVFQVHCVDAGGKVVVAKALHDSMIHADHSIGIESPPVEFQVEAATTVLRQLWIIGYYICLAGIPGQSTQFSLRSPTYGVIVRRNGVASDPDLRAPHAPHRQERSANISRIIGLR
jgi:hypothetical protein